MVETAGRVDLTVLICTYNRARLLERALEHVAAQAVSPSVRWEVLVVDNNATDRTAEVVARFVADPRLPALHYLRERHPGVAFARKRGLLEARGELVAFVDDDCLLERDWIDHALQFAREHPRAGAFGGRNELLWEAPPPRVALLYGVSLAGQDFGGQACRMPSAGRVYPVGAGLVVRRDAVFGSGWVASGVLRGRDPAGLHAGEDSEVVLRLRHHGWEIWYTPLLHLRHVLPPHRTTLPALRRIHRGFGRAEGPG
jgi:glycosyltransferase involved in cell wall biosynthesis